MIKREWRQLLEMIKFSLGKGKAPELRVETDWGKFYRICKFHKIDVYKRQTLFKVEINSSPHVGVF